MLKQLHHPEELQQKSAGGATRARGVERRLSKQGVHRVLDVHLDPVLLSKVQDE